MSFSTPVRDMQFALKHMAAFDRLIASNAYEDISDDLVSAILEELAKFCDNEIAPMNWLSDQKGAVLNGNIVETTPGMKAVHEKYIEGGWGTLAFPAEAGGQNLPSTLSVLTCEAVNAACMSYGLCPMLTSGASKALLHAGTQEQKEIYLGKMISGEWTGTMNLTEPQAGSDLSGIRTKAEKMADGRYKISGQKIYITWGDHEMTNNVIHLVLARLPDAPEGTGGISMFLVPKFHVNADGSLGSRNDVYAVGLEEKLGAHGSPTCVMAFGDNNECYGTLLGEENRGLANMFVMMNSARLDVGMQAVGVAERSFQRALAYAQDRRQGRLAGVKTGDQIPIYQHADVRRTLLVMKALTEASRGICYANAVAHDLANIAPNEEVRELAKIFDALLTPVSKAWCSDRANEVTSMGVQIHGGMGFVEETRAAQHMRDVRICAIYEGTNGIQAMDLVGRKLQGDGGKGARLFIELVRQTITALGQTDDASLLAISERLKNACDGLELSVNWLLQNATQNPENVLAGATPFLKQFGNVAGGHYLAAGVLSLIADPQTDRAWLESKKALLKVYSDNFLAEAVSLSASVRTGIVGLPELEVDLLTG